MSEMSGQHQDASRYTQVKISTSPEIAAKFKATCKAANLSMASVLSNFMARYSQMAHDSKTSSCQTATRRQRRRCLKEIVLQIEEIMMAEEGYRDKIPENLQGAKWHEAACHSIELLQEILELLDDVY